MKQIKIDYALENKTLEEILIHVATLIGKYGANSKITFVNENGNTRIDLLVES